MGRSGREGKISRNDSNNEDGAAELELKKGPWTPEEDGKLSSYVQQYGEGNWRSLSSKAGLKRCGKSCRLRWNNYLRPDIKTGNFSLEEERTIIQLHALLGNRWSAIATHLPKRTDSKIKNHWNSHIKKRLAKMGIDPVTHKPNVDKLSHMTQWEAARLEAEARLVKQPKHFPYKQHNLISPSSSSAHEIHKGPPTSLPYLRCLDVLKVWQGTLTSKEVINGGLFQTPDSKSTFFKEVAPIVPTTHAESTCSLNQGVNTRPHDETETLKQRFDDELIYTHDADFSTGDPLISPPSFCEGFLDLPINDAADDHEATHDEWSGLASNLVLNSWPPVFSQIV